MKLRAGLAAILVLSTFGACASLAANRTQGSRATARDSISVSQWAAQKGMAVRWIKRDESVELTRNGSRIRLQADSREAEINGTSVWLLFPVTRRDGGLWLSQRDLQATFGPILSPPSRAGGTIKNICLDPGHGGRDPGFKAGFSQEKAYTLLLAKQLRDDLTRAGFAVTLTRTSDRYVDLSDRPGLARNRRADLFISLHFNSVGSDQRDVHGTEVYSLTPQGAPSTNSRGETGGAGSIGNRNDSKNLFLAYQVQKALVANLGAVDRGVHRARFVVLRDATMPAVLVEAGFLSHPAEGKKIRDSEYRRKISRAVVEGVQAYKRMTEPRA